MAKDRTKPQPNEPDDSGKPETYMIDILGLELERKAPHWLHPVNSALSEERKREIRDKHRAKHRDEQKKVAREKQWRTAKRKAQSTLTRLRTWDEADHPRGQPDNAGQFAESGGGGGSGSETEKPSGGGETDKPAQQAPTKSGKAPKTMKDFVDDKIGLDDSTTNDPEKQEKFLSSWNEHVDQDPAEFKEQFLGGLNGTMSIDYDASANAISLSGIIKDPESGKRIGGYTREINFDNKSAVSEYFKLDGASQHAGIGKTLLAANIETYQKLDLDRVSTNANIDVGGYAWARYGYVPSTNSWDDLSREIYDAIDGMASGSGYEAESWDMMSDSQKDRARMSFVESSKDEFRDMAIEDWRESGRALDDAKLQLIDDEDQRWLVEAISETRAEGPSAGAKDAENRKIAEGVTLGYDSDGEGRNDIEVEFSEEVANMLSEDERDDLATQIQRTANDRAEEIANNMDAPESVDEDLTDRQTEYWDDALDDKARFKWIENNDPDLLQPTETGTGEIDDDEAAMLRELASSSDPKSIWEIADSKWGKELLLGTDWDGTLNLRDKDTMERFNAYVGKAKAAA